MRPSVAAAWPAFCRSYEGVCYWLYFDTKNLATTGTGNMIDAGGHMSDLGMSLPWMTKAGVVASRATIAHEYDRLKALGIYKQGGYAYQKHASLFLSQVTVDWLLSEKTAEFWAALIPQLPRLGQWPADAQLAIMDMAWHMGPHFLGPKWPNFTAAAKASDYAGMARHCQTAARSPRDARHVRLYGNAAAVVELGVDPDILWLDRPVEPPAPDLEDEIMTMTPEQRAQFVDEIATRVVSRLLYTDTIPAPTESSSNPTWKGISYWQNWTKSLDAIKAKLGVK